MLEDNQAVKKNQDPEYQNTTIRSHDSTQFFCNPQEEKTELWLSQGQHIQLIVGIRIDISLGIKHFIKNL